MTSALTARYEVGGRIGKGGMGEVMAATDVQVGRTVAIKRMHEMASDDGVARFLREARVQGRLEHPAIVPVHEIGQDEAGRPFFAMKLVAGRTLAELIEAGAGANRQQLLRGFADVCLAIEFAHQHGVVHRDLKPDNIMFGEFGEVYVLDWGVAKVIDEVERRDLAPRESAPHVTVAGTVVGTPGYMAPEQAAARDDIDGRADVYTLGCLLFEVLAGTPRDPSRGTGAPADPRPSLAAPDRMIPPELDNLCVAALASDREGRPPARELARRVHEYLDGDRDVALRRRLAAAHLETARAAFLGETAARDTSRATAMRSAAAAIALDPELPGPGELITRLMLEPPDTTPPEVAAVLDEDDARTSLAHARASFVALLCGIAAVPIQWWIAPTGSPHLAAYTGLLIVAAIAVAGLLRFRVAWPGLVVVGNAGIVLAISCAYSPLLIAPGLAAVLAMACALTPRYSAIGSSVAIGLLMLGAALGPLALELAGVLPATVAVGEHGVVFRPPALGGASAPTLVAGAVYSIALIVGATGMADLMRRRTRQAQERLQLQAWQLRLLVADGTGPVVISR